MSEQEFIAIAEKALAEAAQAGRAGVRFQLPRTASRYSEEEGVSAEFLRWLVGTRAQFEVMPAPLSFAWWIVDVNADAFAQAALASTGKRGR
jgi:hypothetical protein